MRGWWWDEGKGLFVCVCEKEWKMQKGVKEKEGIFRLSHVY